MAVFSFLGALQVMIKRFLLFGTALSSLAGPALTDEAQSIGVKLTGLNHYFIDNRTNTYQFDETMALSYYTTTVVGQLAVSCQRAEEGTCSSKMPPLPAAAPDGLEGVEQARADECAFAKGGNLGSHSYTSPIQHIDVNVTSSEHDRWYFVWVYRVGPDPTKSSPVPPLTAWNLVSSTGSGTTAEVSIGATIASESVIISQSFPTGKYSFSLANTLSPGVPDQTTNRVHEPNWTIKDATNHVVFQQSSGATVVDNMPGSTPYDPTTKALDFTYTANAGTYGNASAALMDSNNGASATGTSPSDHTPGDARSILNGGLQNGVYHDAFTPNDDGGADGSDLSSAVVSSIIPNLGPGSYTVTLTGKVEDRAASYSQPFSVTQGPIRISAPDCTQ
jgi:hypothetical protein